MTVPDKLIPHVQPVPPVDVAEVLNPLDFVIEGATTQERLECAVHAWKNPRCRAMLAAAPIGLRAKQLSEMLRQTVDSLSIQLWHEDPECKCEYARCPTCVEQNEIERRLYPADFDHVREAETLHWEPACDPEPDTGAPGHNGGWTCGEHFFEDER